MFRIEKSLTRANVPKTIRFTEPLERQLSIIARGEGISFNEMVLRCCQYALEQYAGDVRIDGTEE